MSTHTHTHTHLWKEVKLFTRPTFKRERGERQLIMSSPGDVLC